jgi:BMFP domain-containing protein YqiC
MNSKNKFKDIIDDVSKVSASAFSVAYENSKELRESFKDQMHKVMEKFDFVKKEELLVVKKMAEKVRLENEDLKKRIEKLEGKATSVKKAPAKKK